MSSIEAAYNEKIASLKEEAAVDRETFERSEHYIVPKSGVKWQFGLTHIEQRPVIKMTCSHCNSISWIFQPGFTHKCRVTSACPEEINEQLKKAQEKRVGRKAKSFVDRLLGKETAPALNNF